MYIRRGTTCFARGIGRSCTRRFSCVTCACWGGECEGEAGEGRRSADERADADGEGERERAEPSETDVAADVSLALSSYSSSELDPPLSSSFLPPSPPPLRRPRRRPLGVSSESSESDMPTTARVDDHVLLMSSLNAGAGGCTSAGSVSVVEICGIGSPPKVPGFSGDIALSFRAAAGGVTGGAVCTVVGADETDAVSSALPEPSVIAVETTDVDAGDTRPLLIDISGEDDSASCSPGGRAGSDAGFAAPPDDASLLSSPPSSVSESSAAAAVPFSRARGLYVPFAIFQQRWQPTMFSPSRISTAVNMRRHSSIPGRCPSFAHSACVASAAAFPAAPAPPWPDDPEMTCWRSSSGFPVTGCTSASTRRRYAMSCSDSFCGTGAFVRVSLRACCCLNGFADERRELDGRLGWTSEDDKRGEGGTA